MPRGDAGLAAAKDVSDLSPGAAASDLPTEHAGICLLHAVEEEEPAAALLKEPPSPLRIASIARL